MVDVVDASFRALMKKADSEGVSHPVEIAILKRHLPMVDKKAKIEKAHRIRAEKLRAQKAQAEMSSRSDAITAAKNRKRISDAQSKTTGRKTLLDLRKGRASAIIDTCNRGIEKAHQAKAARDLATITKSADARREKRMIQNYRRDRAALSPNLSR